MPVIRYLAVILAGLSLVWSGPATAHSPISEPPPPTQAFEDWLADLKAEAAGTGIDRQTLAESLDGIAPIPRIIELDRNQPEFSLTFRQYVDRVAPASRIKRGRRLLAQNRTLLRAISADYGVPPQMIVALWGIESDFGRLTGGFQVIPALATLAYDGRRSKFFRRELLYALRIIDEGHISAAEMAGSWAGAMGQSQFMPSSFINFAVDRDGDGRKNIWTNRPDIMASAANLLVGGGWKAGRIWGRPVRLPKSFNFAVAGLDTRKKLSEWQALGIRRMDGRDLPKADMQASLILPDGPHSAFLVYDNYRAILNWNRSHYFALTAGYLADRIAGKDTVIFKR
ncbi:MAG: lytic murein transglycosylase [Alphaproteobacteria bacterium]